MQGSGRRLSINRVEGREGQSEKGERVRKGKGHVLISNQVHISLC